MCVVFLYILYLYLCHIYIHESAGLLMRWGEGVGKQRDGSNHFATTLSRLRFLSEETLQVHMYLWLKKYENTTIFTSPSSMVSSVVDILALERLFLELAIHNLSE